MADYQNDADIVGAALEPSKKKPKGKTKYDADLNEKLHSAIEAEMSDAYNYSSAELYTQMASAWQWYFRHPLGNELDGFSQWVSPMITKHVNQARAFVTDQYFRNTAPIIKFRPTSADDVEAAELADEYVNHIFRNKLNGHQIVDDLVFNAALLKWNPVRITMKETVNSDEMEFKFTGTSVDAFEEALAHWFAANPEYLEKEPDYKKETIDDKDENGDIDICYRWVTDKVIERYPYIDVISPGAFFVSRQAENAEDARMVAQMSRMTVDELRTNYPDAPAMNGWKKKEEQDFWDTLVSDYLEWYTEIEWLSKWSHDSLGFVSQYTEGNDRAAGLGSKEVFVMDAEINIDVNDKGYSQLCHVIKVGDRILHKKYITERSFMWSSFIPTANRHLGLSFVDLLEQEAAEETINFRAFTDATVQAAHSNPIVDPDQMEMDDVENRGPDTVLRRKRNANAKPGIPGIDWVKQPGPDPSVLQAIETIHSTATSLTGVGANFQGATSDDVSDMRVSTETAKIIDNNSSLMLNYFARNFANHLSRILVKLLNVAVNHGATTQLLQIKDSWNEVTPGSNLKGRSDFIMNADIGVNDAQEKLNRATTIMSLIQSASGGGGQNPDGTPIPAIPLQLTPSAGFEAAKALLSANGVMNVEDYLIDPKTAKDQVQQQGVQEMIQQQVQQGIQAGVQQAMEQAMQAPEAQKVLAEVAELNARAGKTIAETDKVDAEVEEKVFSVATKIDAEDRREETDVENAAVNRDKANTADWKAREDIRLREIEMEELKRATQVAETTSATAVINP